MVSARELASLVGKIISAGAVFGNISRIMTRYCTISVAAAQDQDSKFTLDQYCIREMGNQFGQSEFGKHCRLSVQTV